MTSESDNCEDPARAEEEDSPTSIAAHSLTAVISQGHISDQKKKDGSDPTVEQCASTLLQFVERESQAMSIVPVNLWDACTDHGSKMGHPTLYQR